MSTVMAPASGVVSLLKVSEGENVRAGQVVAVLTVPRATVGEGDTSAALEKRIRERVQGLKDVQAADQSQLDAQIQGGNPYKKQAGRTGRRDTLAAGETARRQLRKRTADQAAADTGA
ncbi:hypothetical protein G6F32_016331 [Rhizopus arrhizus]|nr:hypothetical protein G6F32_016331 [Rhizopus arrhizus]